MTRFRLDDTICAISTPLGSGGIGMVRLSGPQSLFVLHKVFHPSKKEDIRKTLTHTLHHGFVIGPKGEKIDEVVVGIYRAPNSYTRQDVVEVNGHGSVVVLRKILDVFLKQGLRLAERGEFTRRAFLNGRVDLPQAEAVLDMVEANCEQVAEAAIANLSGRFSSAILGIREKLIRLYAHVEASIDFPDEEITADSRESMKNELNAVISTIGTILASYKRTRRIKEGFTVVLIGKPNVGKSSILNVLLGRNRALVSVIPGTTRDALEELLDWRGYCICLVDTAGMGSSDRILDRLSREKTEEYLTDSQLLIFIMDGSTEWDKDDEKLFSLIKDKQFIPVVNKIDLPQCIDSQAIERVLHRTDLCFTSARTHIGIDILEKRITDWIEADKTGKDFPWLFRERQKIALEQSLDALDRASKALSGNLALETFVFDLKQALDRLGELIGEVYSDDVLDKIFSEFCIGK